MFRCLFIHAYALCTLFLLHKAKLFYLVFFWFQRTYFCLIRYQRILFNPTYYIAFNVRKSNTYCRFLIPASPMYLDLHFNSFLWNVISKITRTCIIPSDNVFRFYVFFSSNNKFNRSLVFLLFIMCTVTIFIAQSKVILSCFLLISKDVFLLNTECSKRYTTI
jgi:hypothetical protein